MITTMLKDKSGATIPAFNSDPAKAQVPVVLAAGESVTLGRSGTYDYDVTTWLAVQVYCDQPLIRWFNEDSTKTRTVSAESDVLVVLGTTVDKLTIKNNGASDVTLEIEGM